VVQYPDRRVAWAAVEGARNSGAVSFLELGPTLTRVTLDLDYEPVGLVRHIGDAVGLVTRRAVSDLERFTSFVEGLGSAPGGRPGEVSAVAGGIWPRRSAFARVTISARA